MRRSGTIANLIMGAAVAWFGLTGVTAASPLYPQARATASSTAGDECSVLKKEDVAAALGGTVNGPKSKGPLPMGPGLTVTSCEYTGSGSSLTLNLMRVAADQLPIHKGLCEQQKHDGLAGLGDLACWYNDKHEELHVFKGTTLLSIELRGKSSPTEPIKELAQKVLAQLR